MNIDFTEKIIGKEKYFSSAVIALVIEKNDKKYFLFEKRARGVRQGGDVSFPGGKIEADETSLEAALRECKEEIGIDEVDVKGKIGTLVIPSGIMVEAFLGIIEEKKLKKLKINEDEVEGCFLVPVDFFKKNSPRIEKLEVETKPIIMKMGRNLYFQQWN